MLFMDPINGPDISEVHSEHQETMGQEGPQANQHSSKPKTEVRATNVGDQDCLDFKILGLWT